MATTTSTVSNLQKAREKAGLTRKKASKLTGISEKMVYQLERGIRRLHADQIEAFAKVYTISTDYILGLTDTPLAPQYDKAYKEVIGLFDGVKEEKKRAIILAVKSIKESLK